MIAVIPARGGSKGLPGKNIRDFNGKPLIYYTICEAKKAKRIERIIVSTDDPEIADISLSYGADIPFYRPAELATDNALAIDNYIYTIQRMNRDFGQDIQQFVVLQPTSPLRTAADIDQAMNLFQNNDADSVISVVKFSHPPHWAKGIDEQGRIGSYFKDTEIDVNMNRQHYLPAFVPNGAIFVFKTELLLRKHSYYSDRTYAYVMPQERSIDIDTLLDFEYAQLLMKRRDG